MFSACRQKGADGFIRYGLFADSQRLLQSKDGMYPIQGHLIGGRLARMPIAIGTDRVAVPIAIGIAEGPAWRQTGAVFILFVV